MELREAIRRRRSIRRYTPTPIPPETLRDILEAGIWAPSSGGTRPYKLLPITDRPQIDALYETIRREHIPRQIKRLAGRMDPEELTSRLEAYLDGIRAAAAHVLLLHDLQAGADRFTGGDVEALRSNPYLYGSLGDSLLFTAQNIMLQAAAYGRGSLYMETVRPEGPAVLRHLGLRDTLELTAIIPIGTPDEHPEPQPRSLEDHLIQPGAPTESTPQPQPQE